MITRAVRYLLLCCLGLISVQNFGQPGDAQFDTCASAFIKNLPDRITNSGQFSLDTLYSMTRVDEVSTLASFTLKPEGFIHISKHPNGYSVIGFSLRNNLPEGNTESLNSIQSIMGTMAKGAFYRKKNVKKTAESGTSYGPFVNTLWGQVNCKDENNNIINVTNYYTPGNYAAGCVAISMATLMHYYKWPGSGTGSITYSDNSGSSTGTYSVDFDEAAYDMNLMKDSYNHVASSTVHRQEAGKLAYHSAVALNMDFEYNGSTSNVNKIPKAASDYFRYYGFFKASDSPVFWELLDKNMQEGIPVILAIKSSNGAGHSIVCDGLSYLDETPYYHLNMGWWGAVNGWYTIRDIWSAGGYDEITGAVFDMTPSPEMMEPDILSDDQLKISWRYPSFPVAEGFELQHQKGNEDWKVLETDFTDTSYIFSDFEQEHKNGFRVRAKINGEYYPSAWSNTTALLPVSIHSYSPENRRNLEVYPVPFHNKVTISGFSTTAGRTRIQITDLQGKICFLSLLDAPGSELEINTSEWNPGVYIIQAIQDGRSIHQKIVKTKY